MKRCPECNQIFKDEYGFCLSDGTPLVPENSFDETPTVIRSSVSANQEKKGTNPLIYAALGILLVMLIGGASAGFVLYNLSGKTDPKTGDNAAIVRKNSENKNVSLFNENGGDELVEQRKELEEREDQLKRERERLDKEKKDLEAQKNKSNSAPPTAENPPTVNRTATVISPPTNIRETPNGTIICVIKNRTVISILGTTGIRDTNGIWYYTNACGKTGVVHSTQLKF